jgi:thiol-disulfide isomerase/thioredoxin
MSRRIAKFGIQAAAMGRISGGTNVYEYRYANEFQGILGIEYPVNHWLDTGLMGALITSGHDYDHDKKVANTGGLWGYLIPRFVFKTTGVQVESSVQIPVYTFVNGGQLVSDAVFSTGLRFNLTRTATTLLATRETLGAPLHERASLGDFARLQPCVNCDITSVLPAEKWTLVEFMSDVCGACKDFDPVIKQFASDYPDVAVRQFDYLTATDEQIARYDIVETPTVILFDPSGQQVERVVGADLASIKRRLEK